MNHLDRLKEIRFLVSDIEKVSLLLTYSKQQADLDEWDEWLVDIYKDANRISDLVSEIRDELAKEDKQIRLRLQT